MDSHPDLANGEVKPFNFAVIISGVYLLSGAIYIYISSHIAATNALQIQQLEQIELLKGFLFVLVTTVFLFLGLLFLFNILRQKQRNIQRQQEAIVAAGKQAAAGLFASSIAHDLNNLLMAGQFSIDQLLKNQNVSPSDKRHVERLAKMNNQIKNFTNNLSKISEKQLSSGIRELNIVSPLISAINLASSHYKVRRCSIEQDLPSRCLVFADESILHRSVLNLLINAADANNGRGRILVRLREDPKNVKIEVHDEGPGLSHEEQKRILEPFYTTKSDGSGLGLLSVRYCAKIHQGAFYFRRSEFGGACIRIVLPKQKRPLVKATANWNEPPGICEHCGAAKIRGNKEAGTCTCLR